MWRMTLAIVAGVLLMAGSQCATTTEDYWRLALNARNDPNHFSRAILGHNLWGDETSGQLAIKHALRRGDRMIMAPAGHSTGKSFVLADIVLEVLSVPHAYAPHLSPGADIRVVLMSRTGAQLGDVLWRNVRSQYQAAKYPLGGRMLEREGWKVSANRAAVLLNADDPEAVQGKHAELQVIIVDEGNKVPKPIWDSIRSLMAGGNTHLVVCLNPVVSAGYCYEMAKRRDLWTVIPISCLDHPNVITGRDILPGGVNRQWVEEICVEHCGHIMGSVPWEEVDRRIRSGEYGGDYIESRVLGRFPKSSPDQFIDLALLEHAAARGTDLPVADDGNHIGLDPAWLGEDKSVLTVLDETRTLIHVEWWQSQDGNYSAGRVRAAMEKFGISKDQALDHVHIEAVGVGASTIDALKADDVWVDNVQPGGGLVGDWVGVIPEDIPLANRKSELWWAAREMLQKGLLSIPEEFGEVWADLTAPKITYNAKGEIRVEPKEKVKKRLGRSPDFGESLITALSRNGYAKIGFDVMDGAIV